MSKLATTPWYYLKPLQYRTLLDVAPTLRRKALYALTYTAGLRLGEALSLTWSESEIDFDTGEVTIENRSGTATMPLFHVKDHRRKAAKVIDRLVSNCDVKCSDSKQNDARGPLGDQIRQKVFFEHGASTYK